MTSTTDRVIILNMNSYKSKEKEKKKGGVKKRPQDMNK